MSELSRRGFLAGLLSSAAVIAAGPVAKVIPSRALVGFRSVADYAFLEGMSQSIATTLWYGNLNWSPLQFAGLTPSYNANIDGALTWPQDIRSNVLDCGEPPGASWETHWGLPT